MVKKTLTGFLILSMVVHAVFLSAQDKAYRMERERMVTKQIVDRGIIDSLTIEAMKKVPRHLFVPPHLSDKAYNDAPLPIGYNQTISQPYIVAYMTSFLELEKSDKVLEIGTGSGYQAAVLAEIVDSVFTIEIVSELVQSAAEKFALLGLDNVRVKLGDGYFGWPEFAPFDKIIVTAAAEEIPPLLVEQLKEDGKMILPVGPEFRVQYLVLIEKRKGKIVKNNLLPVRFVPFTRD
jgi:protein-L-isoaspartate(D-aspartate) O-methyltransferase